MGSTESVAIDERVRSSSRSTYPSFYQATESSKAKINEMSRSIDISAKDSQHRGRGRSGIPKPSNVNNKESTTALVVDNYDYYFLDSLIIVETDSKNPLFEIRDFLKDLHFSLQDSQTEGNQIDRLSRNRSVRQIMDDARQLITKLWREEEFPISKWSENVNEPLLSWATNYSLEYAAGRLRTISG